MQDYQGQSTSVGFITGMLCGAAVGATLGVLLAPRAGAETRRQLAESSGRLREGASEGVNTLISRGRDAMERGRSAFERTRETATAAADTYADTFGKPSVPTV